METINVIFAGVGGQGILTASDVLALAAIREGLDCKKSEVHGMAQRGGSVVSHVRIGDKVFSPVIPQGAADFLVSFERLEGLRRAHCLRSGGAVVQNLLEIFPMGAQTDTEYPGDMDERMASFGLKVIYVSGQELAVRAGDARAAGSVLLGALSVFLPISRRSWADAMKGPFKAGKARTNLRAFDLGREWASTRP